MAIDWSWWLPILLSTALGGLITYAAVVYQAKMQAAAEQRKLRDIEAAEAEKIKRKARDRDNSPHWRAAKHLLEVSLFQAVPSGVANETIEKLLEHFEERAGLSENLFRASRLFVESRIFRAARNEKIEPLTAESVDEAVSKLRAPLDSALASLDTPPLQPFATCFQLGKIDVPETHPKASTYFEALAEVDHTLEYSERTAGEEPGERWRSLTRVTVDDGFVAPTYLVGGLLNEFEEDWQVLLRSFRANVPQDSGAFVRVQRFEFYCWLLWGPSIPACDCEAWNGSFVALQYGYGDENNSFPLVLEREIYRSGWDTMRQAMVSGSKRPVPMAVGAKFTGSVAWGPRVNAAYPETPSIYFVEKQPVFKGLMLRADTIEPIVERRLYYSAYAWIMFEACTPAMQPLYRSRDDRWKFLLPIFEHANIADGTTLEFLKKRLAEKAWRAILDLEQSGEIRFRYVCAIDDPGSVATASGTHDLRFQLGEAARPERLRELLIKTILISEGAAEALEPADKGALAEAMSRSETCTRLFSRPEDEEYIITSCDLPEIVEGCYRSARGARAG